MKRLIFIFALMLAACGGGGSDCDFAMSTFTNGATLATATTYWDCQAEGNAYQFTFTDDGAGLEVGTGAFTWEETGCRELVANTSLGDVFITDIQGSIASGVVSFTMSADLTLHSSCVLQNL